MKVIGIVLFVILSSSALAASDGDYGRGWFWYEDPVEKEIEDPEEVVPEPKQAAAMAPIDVLKKQGEDWERAMAVAVLEPTEANIKDYMARTQAITAQGQRFSTAFKQTLWTAPQYDFSLKRPTAPEAVMAKNQFDHLDQEKTLNAISDEKGLIFFFRSDCPYCHKFSPVLKRFSDEYGFTVIPVSLDGPGLPEFPYPKKNVGLGHKLNVTSVPAVFMVNPDENELAPVGYGYRDWGALTQQIIFADQKMKGKVALGGTP